MMHNRMICRSSATLGVEPTPRTQSAGSVWAPDEDAPHPRVRRTPKTTNSATLELISGEHPVENFEVQIVRVTRRTQWFEHAVAELPKRAPHISPDLMALAAEDE